MPFYYYVRIPRLDPEVSHQSNEVEIVEYLAHEGDTVSPGTPLALVENYWAVFQVEAMTPGYLSKTFFSPGTQVHIGDPIAIVLVEGEDLRENLPLSAIKVVRMKREKGRRQGP